MKIVEMTAKGFMGLNVTEVELDGKGGTVEVHGDNEQGKSRFLDIIGAAVGGAKYMKHIKDAISTGGKRASITVKTDDGYTILREWTKKGNKLHIVHEDGTVMQKPADWLKGIIGEISFDPMAFAHMQPRDQKAYLLTLCGLEEPLAKLEAKKKPLQAKKKELREDMQVESKVLDREEKPDKTKLIKSEDDFIDVEEKEEELNSAIDEERSLRETKEDIENDIPRLEEELKQFELNIAEWKASIAESKKSLAETISALEKVCETQDLEEEIEAIKEHNQQIFLMGSVKDLKKTISDIEKQADATKEALDAIEDERIALLENADFPVDDISFDEDGVIYQGLPFSQAAQSQRLRVSMRIAIAKNPDFKVIRVNDAALLDEKSMAEMEALAKDKDYQIFLECVGVDRDKDGNIISKGIVLEDNSVVCVDGVTQTQDEE